MAGDAQRPLTTEQAKARFREAVRQAGVAGWTRRHPYRALLVAMAVGVVAGSSQRLAGQAPRLLLGALISSLRWR